MVGRSDVASSKLGLGEAAVVVSVDVGVLAHIDSFVGVSFLVLVEFFELFDIPRNGGIFVVILVNLECFRE